MTAPILTRIYKILKTANITSHDKSNNTTQQEQWNCDLTQKTNETKTAVLRGKSKVLVMWQSDKQSNVSCRGSHQLPILCAAYWVNQLDRLKAWIIAEVVGLLLIALKFHLQGKWLWQAGQWAIVFPFSYLTTETTKTKTAYFKKSET